MSALIVYLENEFSVSPLPKNPPNFMISKKVLEFQEFFDLLQKEFHEVEQLEKAKKVK